MKLAIAPQQPRQAYAMAHAAARATDKRMEVGGDSAPVRRAKGDEIGQPEPMHSIDSTQARWLAGLTGSLLGLALGLTLFGLL